jgi:hypothetical protein
MSGENAQKPKQAAADPLAFASSLESVYADAEAITEKVTLTLRDTNQFWFVIPNGILPSDPSVDITVPYMRFTPEGRRTNMLTRMIFSRDGGAVADTVSGKRLLLEFRPCVLLSRSKEGRTQVQRMESFDGPLVTSEQQTRPPEPQPQGAAIPDIGVLLEGLQETRKSLDTIDTLLAKPDALLTEDEQKRQELQETLASTKDKVLMGLGDLGNVLSLRDQHTLDHWRQEVSKALSTTIEAMVAFDDLAGQVRDDKRRELEVLRQSIDAYFSTIDPAINVEQCRRFSAGVNQIILEDRKQTLEVKRGRIEKTVERNYDHIISSLWPSVNKGTTLPLIPHPTLEAAEGYFAKIVLNMIHIVMVVRLGGLSIRLDTMTYSRLHSDLRGWDTTNPPRVHIVDRRRFLALRSGAGQSGLASFD